MSSLKHRLLLSGMLLLPTAALRSSQAEETTREAQKVPAATGDNVDADKTPGPGAKATAASDGVTARKTSAVPAEPGRSSEPTSAPARPVGLAPLETGPAAVKGKWNPTLYGFIVLDTGFDSTQSFTGACPGYFPIAKPGTYAGEHARTFFDARGSRFGFRLAAPEMDGMKATAVIELDFLGNQLPTNYGAGPNGISENASYTNGLFRIRHAAIKVETRYIDVLAGQYWQLFGWIPMYLPVVVQVPGLPGIPYGRSPQFRLSHTFATKPINVELAIAAARPPQRNSAYPDGQAGGRLIINGWRGVNAVGATGATFFEIPAGIGVSGVYRRLKVAEFVATPTKSNEIDGGGVSVDAFLPLIPSTLGAKANALNVTGNFTVGRGIADLYSPGTPGNAGFPTLLNADGTLSPTPWPQDVDNGLVTYDRAGVLHAIKWQTLMLGGQYYLPPSGRVWIAGNYGYARSSNLASYDLNPKSIITKYTLWDAVMYVNVVGPVTMSGEFAQEKQTYGDGTKAKNNRVMVSSYYTFW